MDIGPRLGTVLALAILLSSGCSTPAQAEDPGGTPSPPVDRPGSPPADPATTLVARVVSYSDVWVVPVTPDIAVYADGSVYTPGWRTPGTEHARYAVRRLTPMASRRSRTSSTGSSVPGASSAPARRQASGAGSTPRR